MFSWSLAIAAWAFVGLMLLGRLLGRILDHFDK
jgi:hypothetical protein